MMSHERWVIGSIGDLRRLEGEVLSAVRRARWGPQRFLVDPIRTLRDEGFQLTPAFITELRCEMPAVDALPCNAYEEVLAGRHPLCRDRIEIKRLGIPDLADRRST